MRYDLLTRELNDDILIYRLKKCVRLERKTQAKLIAHLGEVERRKLYAIHGYSSMFLYVVQELGYSEASALKRIQIARKAMKFPQIYALLEERNISLTALMKLCPHLKVSNAHHLLEKSQKKSVREVEQMLCESFPKPQPLDSITPLDKDRVWFQFCADKAFAKRVEQTRDLLRHKYPNGKLKDIFSEVLRDFIQKQEKKKMAFSTCKTTTKPGSRHIPQRIKVAVWKRDGGKCSFVSPHGKRCEEKGFLEFDHKMPFSLGRKSDDIKNIRLLCRTHNQLMAEDAFGIEYVRNKIAEKHKDPYEQELYMNRFMLDRWEMSMR